VSNIHTYIHTYIQISSVLISTSLSIENYLSFLSTSLHFTSLHFTHTTNHCINLTNVYLIKTTELVLPMKKLFHGELLKLKLHCPLERIERMSKMAITCKIFLLLCVCVCLCGFYLYEEYKRKINLYHLITHT
jgi:hypothetical protein